jgi:phosphoribosylformimino-5-aminoimidazole carboxamide ribotide isomerase
MQVWPAVDLLDGKCVRLQQGDYQRVTVFHDNPVAQALEFQAAGARHLHIVDLDGARDGRSTNRNVIRDIVAAVDMQCELGGGVRDQATIDDLLGLGLHRLVLGTKALKSADWFREMCLAYPEQLVLGIDAKDGFVATDGWYEVSRMQSTELADLFRDVPLAAIVYTDIATDGMMRGPNLPEMSRMRRHVNVPVVASGGVTTIDDIRNLAQAGLAGAIIGRALYDGAIDLAEAIMVSQSTTTSERATTGVQQ